VLAGNLLSDRRRKIKFNPMTRSFLLEANTHTRHPLNLESALNPEQLAAATCSDGPKLVIAGAGSGKTRTITYRVAYLMSKGISPSSIMLATFTNKAAREMLSRVEALTGSDVGKLWGGTFHAIGNRILRHFAKLLLISPSYSILDDEDSRDLIKVCISESKIKTDEKRFPAPGIIQDMISFSFNTAQELSAVIENQYPHFFDWVLEVESIEKLYNSKKCKACAMDYDDLLRYWLILLREHPDVAVKLGAQFRNILVDEYQDTNAIQAEIVEKLSAHNGQNLMVVGDDSQSIYAFRGANYDNILKFPERNPGTEVFKLQINYRSTPEILSFTNASIRNNEKQFHKTLTPTRNSGALPVVIPINDVFQEASFVAQRILQLRDDGIPLAQIAVLYRAHSHSTLLQVELVRRGIPYESRSGVRVFEQAHIKDVVSYLKVLDNPFDEVAWRRLFLMIPRVGNATAGKLWLEISKASDPIQALLVEKLADRVSSSARPFFKKFQQDIKALKSQSLDALPSTLISNILQSGYSDYMRAKYEVFQSRIEDIQQLAMFARTYNKLSELLSELILLGELYAQEAAQGKANRDTERVILSSVHQAKGLEWQVVFVIRLCDGDFPSNMALREQDGEEEERRIFYVAATRAKDELYITHPLIDRGNRSNSGMLLAPSRFLKEINFRLYEQGEVEEANYFFPEVE
jgi:DNA helicase II / ATP-dependent DNA helicase PcrA